MIWINIFANYIGGIKILKKDQWKLQIQGMKIEITQFLKSTFVLSNFISVYTQKETKKLSKKKQLRKKTFWKNRKKIMEAKNSQQTYPYPNKKNIHFVWVEGKSQNYSHPTWYNAFYKSGKSKKVWKLFLIIPYLFKDKNNHIQFDRKGQKITVSLCKVKSLNKLTTMRPLYHADDCTQCYFL